MHLHTTQWYERSSPAWKTLSSSLTSVFGVQGHHHIQFVLNIKHQHTEGTFQSFLLSKPLGNTYVVHNLLGVEGLVKHEDRDFSTTGLQQKATLELLSSLCFPQASHCPAKGKAKAASISVAGTANESNRVDTEWVFPQSPPCSRQQPSIYHASFHQYTSG